ncbi:MAG TPA: ABC transporter permease [Actinophytocola sp.]|uniref:ABC transporter permease n=1 Tax=Actinophytocola sp. TaxID=1872138 RepID=UPI002DDDB737|nr:ABC transporter permease [Actinophytocola sp.]HEV2781231.1 ABC transporter permease [Actinophytocola sp.]
MTALTKLTLTETKLFFREPVGVFFVLIFPALLLVILGSIPSFRQPNPDLGGARVINLYAPIVIAMSIAMLALSGLPQLLATYREKGILRRMAVTPVRPIMVLTAQLVMCAVMSVATTAVVLAIGRIAFDVELPRQIAAYAVAYLLSVVASLAIGLLIAALAPSGKGAGAIGSVLFFPVLLGAGLWLPRDLMPVWGRRISDFTPLGAGVQSLQDAAGGAWPQLLHVAVMLSWTIGAGALAVRFFRWE